MADLGSVSLGRSVALGLLAQQAGAFAWIGETEYNVGSLAQPPRNLAGGGSGGATVFVDRTLYTDAPVSTLTTGDHGLSFFSALLPVENTSQTEPYPEVLYVVPAGCRAYIREFRLFNTLGTTQAAELWFKQFPVFKDSLEAGATYVEDGLWILQAGQEVEGSGPDDVDGDGVWCWISGILERS